MSNDRVYTGNNGSRNRGREERTKRRVKCEFADICGSGNSALVQCSVKDCPLRKVNK